MPFEKDHLFNPSTHQLNQPFNHLAADILTEVF